MRKNSITRFNSENIAYVDFDTDTKEGEAGIIDEVNGQTYPFNGGGGISNPVIEITFINNTGSNKGPELHILDENTILDVQFEIANGATEVINAVVVPASFDGPEGPFIYTVPLWHMECTKTASSEVNCTYDSGDDILILTDTSENGSVTITLS